MRRTMLRAKTAGFTLIELVVVIVILGLLAATALPRFLDLTSDAQKATVQAVTGGLSSAVGIAHAKWAVNGSPSIPSVITLDGTNINLTSKGWPVGTSGATTTPTITEVPSTATPVGSTYTALPTGLASDAAADTMCVAIWNANLAGGRPSIAEELFTTAGDHSSGTKIDSMTTDYAALGTTTTNGGAKELSKCEYKLVKKPGKVITYDLAKGEVTVVNN